jgi:DnaK suppressor protein
MIKNKKEQTQVMDQKKLKALREKLVVKKQQILEAYNKNKTYGKEADEDGAQDIADKASNSYTKEFLFSLSNAERDVLALVDEALNKIGDRRYGFCAVCEDEMDKKRLEAIPWAKHCLSCQEKQEQGLL